jgi:hypothetical protein|tara:strand:+ start:12342 stop:12506 length:165 start_codon:yes stop_codon:yes gene_type:complete
MLIGFGLSLLSEEIIIKIQGQNFFHLGTASLVVFNVGMVLLAQVVITKIKLIKV